MSKIFPDSSDDEQDPREDQYENFKREEEMKLDKPPHHENQSAFGAGAGVDFVESVLQKPDPLNTTPTAE